MSNVYPTSPSRLDFGGKGTQHPSVDGLRKGSTFRRRIQVENLNLSGLTIRSSVKEGYGVPPAIFFISTETAANKPRILIDPDRGEWFELIVPAAASALLDAGNSNCWPRRKRYVYDLELVETDGRVFSFLEGEFWISDEITTES